MVQLKLNKEVWYLGYLERVDRYGRHREGRLAAVNKLNAKYFTKEKAEQIAYRLNKSFKIETIVECVKDAA